MPPHTALRPPVLAADAPTWHLFKQGAFESQVSDCIEGSGQDTSLRIPNAPSNGRAPPGHGEGGRKLLQCFVRSCRSTGNVDKNVASVATPEPARAVEEPVGKVNAPPDQVRLVNGVLISAARDGTKATAEKDATPPNGSASTVILVSVKPKEVKKADYSFLDLAVRNFEVGKLTSCEGTGQSKRKAKFPLFKARYLLQHESEPSMEVPKPVSVVGTPSGRARVPREYCTPSMEHRSMLKEAWCKRTLHRANPHAPAVSSSLAQPTEPGQPGLLSPLDKGHAPCASDTFYRSPKQSLPGELWNRAIVNWKGVGPEERAKAFASRASAPVSTSESAPEPEPEPAEACPLQSRVRSAASLVPSRAETSSPPHTVMSSPTSRPSRLPVPGRGAVSSIPRLAQASPPSPLTLHSSEGAPTAAATSASQSQKAREKENVAPAPADSMQRPTVVRSRLLVHSVVRSLQPTQPVVGKSWADGHAALANPQGATVEKRAALSPVVNDLAKRRADSASHSLIPVACVSSIPRHVPSSTHLRKTTVVGEPSPNSVRQPTSVSRSAPCVALAADGQMAATTADK